MSVNITKLLDQLFNKVSPPRKPTLVKSAQPLLLPLSLIQMQFIVVGARLPTR